MEEQASFLGTGWGFPPTFVKSSQTIELTTAEEDICKSLEILLSTHLGERLMEPGYGCDMTKLLFEPLDTTLRSYMKDLITDAILYYEPRIELEDVILEPERELEGRIDIIIHYTILATNTRTNYVYPFYLTEGTDINR